MLAPRPHRREELVTSLRAEASSHLGVLEFVCLRAPWHPQANPAVVRRQQQPYATRQPTALVRAHSRRSAAPAAGFHAPDAKLGPRPATAPAAVSRQPTRTRVLAQAASVTGAAAPANAFLTASHPSPSQPSYRPLTLSQTISAAMATACLPPCTQRPRHSQAHAR